MKLFPALVFLLYAASLQAQSTVGLSMGFNHMKPFQPSQNVGRYTSEHNVRPGYALTFTFKERKEKVLNLAASLSLVSRDYSSVVRDGGLGYQIQTEVQAKLQRVYFSIYPEWSSGNKVRFHFGLGPSFSIFVSGYSKGFHSTTSMGRTEKGAFDDRFARFTPLIPIRMSGIGGVETELKDRLYLLADASFSIGITSLFGNEDIMDFSFTTGLPRQRQGRMAPLAGAKP